ncbi:MAG: hypothetical protein QF441_03445 [Bacteriovoracaceae bacterium]|nr:hypothetical protein [Halobacteriovoraceae bacterium]MDP7319632.1 hypothetical protein [Bacteriovoracaceae bacterium]
MKEESTLAKRSELHIMRRVWHVLCGLICMFFYYTLINDLLFWGYFALVVALLGFFLDFQRLKKPKLNEVLSRLFGPIMRRSEKLSFSGLPFYALGCAVSIFLYQKEIAILSIMFLIFADPMASIVGVYWGRDRLLPNKTLQGTVTAFVVCFVVSMIYMSIREIHSGDLIMFAFWGAIAGAISELMSAFNIDDNLTIPVISGAVLTILNFWLNIF